MRKGAKRKRSQKEEEAAPAPAPANHKTTESTKPPTRAKRVKASKPEPEPEYFEDQRNLEDLWKQIFPVGTEWDQLDKVYGFNWNFSNLENAFEEGGALHGKTVYLFGCTEPQLVPFKDENILIYIPAVVAVVSPFPPSNKIGIKSVQREVEEIIPMKQMKMDWVPYIPLEDRESRVDRLRHQIFILSCTQRRFLVARTDCSSISLLLPIFTKYILQSYIVFKFLTGICGQLIWAALKHLKIDRIKKYEYCLPYFYNPLLEDELEQSTEVQIIFPSEPKPIFCEFDWELDELQEFIDKLIQEEELSEDQKDAFKEFVKEKVREAKKANREAREARRKALEEMSEETRRAIENLRFYKFYPVQTPDTPDISKVKASFINRYYGKAHEVL
ncbi:protein HEAT INTOLERANT 4-like isoform X1 [Populus alba x Populus x berolinensis]|nr:protein HEAT INTOLERANT 4-like isoform X1 [Populus alba x Populus x berolinensis]